MPCAAPQHESRKLGGTDLYLPALGIGCAGIGNLHGAIVDQQAADVIEEAWRSGVRYFDTAPLYGRGLGEIRLGNSLRSRPRSDFVLSSKVGWLAQPLLRQDDEAGLPCRMMPDYTYEGTMRSVEDTLNRTGLGRLDLAIIHDIDEYNHGERQQAMFKEAMDGALPALQELQRDGLIGAIGIGVNSVEVCLDCLAHADPDCFMLAGRYTLLDQSAAELLLPRCLGRNVGVIAAAPFNSGILAAGAGHGRAHYDYREAPGPIVERVKRISALCADTGVELMAAALRFPLLHPAVTAVLPGPRTAAQVRLIAAAFEQNPPPAFWADLGASQLVQLPEGLLHA